MSKLNNVKAVNEMMRGEHRTQTRKSKGYEEKIVNNYGPKSKSEHKDDTGTVVTFLKR